MGSKLRAAGVPLALATLLLFTGGNAHAQLSLPPDYAWRQLSPAGEAGSNVRAWWEINPRGEWVTFVGDVENTGAEAVYAIRRNGATLHRLSPYGPAFAVADLDLSPDGRRVLYRGELETNGLSEAWSAPLAGAPTDAVKLNLPVVGYGVLAVIEPDQGTRIGYIAETSTGFGFWSVPAAGPAAASLRLDPGLAVDEVIYGGLVAPDGSRAVLFIFNQTTEIASIWSVPLDGPAESGLFLIEAAPAGCLPHTGAVGSGFLVYALSCDTPVGERTNQLWSVPLAGPANAALSLAGSFVEGGALDSLQISPDGEYLVLRADKLVDEKFELWSVPVAGPAGALVRLNPALGAGGDVESGVAISPDSSRVAYVADQVTDQTFRAWSVPIAGPSTEATPLVSGIVVANGDVRNLDFTPDGTQIVFRADLSENERFDLYSVPADGSAMQDQITNDSSIPGPTFSVGSKWHLHPDGLRVVYVFDEDAPNDARGLGEQRLSPRYIQDKRLNGDPVAGGQVSSFAVFPDSAGTLYYSDELVDTRYHLFTVDSRLFGDGFEEGTTAAWADVP